MPALIDEVNVAVDGKVWLAPVGTAGPTTALSTLNAAFFDYGYVSEDGVTKSTSITTEQIRAWQNAKVVRETVTESAVTFALTLIQTSAQTVSLYAGGTVAGDGSISVNPAAQRTTYALVIDIIDGADRIRLYAPEARVTEVGDQVYANGSPIGYEITLTANYSEAILGSVKEFYSGLAAPAVPTITSALPSGASQGQIVTIKGSGFTGVTGAASVKFGATNALQYVVDSDDTIYATVPAGTAGAANITVTNATGTSAAFAYTRGA